MDSCEWNYVMLDLVDYLQEKLNELHYTARMTTSSKNRSDPWENFWVYCSREKLNWRVNMKMIEYTVYESFESVTQMAYYKAFWPQQKEEGNLSGLKRFLIVLSCI